jgi:hypothetical protein
LLTKDPPHIVETVSRKGLASKNSRHEFLIIRSSVTRHIQHLVFFTTHGAYALYGASNMSSAIISDVIWNGVGVLSGLEIENTSWFTWRRSRSKMAGTDPYDAAIAVAGYPSLQKAWVAQAAAGYPNLQKAWAANAAAGHPNLKKAQAASTAAGYPGLKKSLAV